MLVGVEFLYYKPYLDYVLYFSKTGDLSVNLRRFEGAEWQFLWTY